MACRLSLCQAPLAQLLLVDVQERLCAAMTEDCLQALRRNLGHLTKAARLLDIPILVSEQYPQGLGATLAPIRQMLPGDQGYFEKTHFSCCAEGGFDACLWPVAQRPQLVLAGMETHVCVLQTAAGLLERGYEVFVAADAVCSRDPHNKANALQRLAQAGVIISNTESIAFEWLGDSRNSVFKAVVQGFR